MGKRDNWCDKKGMEARQKGMKKDESKSRKMMHCVLFSTSFVIYMVIGGLYADRSSNAIHISEEFKVYGLYENVPAYDTCSFPTPILDPSVS